MEKKGMKGKKSKKIGRREFLKLSGIVAASVAVSGLGKYYESTRQGNISRKPLPLVRNYG